MNSYIVSPLSRRDIESMASKIRGKAGLPDETHFPIINFFEHWMGRIFPKFNYRYVSAEEMREYEKLCGMEPTGESEGLTIRGENLVVIREDVLGLAELGDGHSRYTFAHEIGHFILHLDGIIGFPRGGSHKVPAYQKSEWQANAFAAALLMPRDLVTGLDVDEIVQLFCVSKRAAQIRIEEIMKQ